MPGSASPPQEQIYPRIIQALVKARRDAGLRQLDVAERLGQPQSFVSRYETLERRIDVGQFVEVALAIGVDPTATLAEVLTDVPSRCPAP